MPSIINTNMASLNSQRHLNNSQSALYVAMERLSSGKRINSAKDDAAGMSITGKMTTQINGMNQAVRNSYDGVSLGQTAEGALTTSADMLQRIRVLAIQASNATNSPADRQAIQQEVAQLAAELNRIAETTSFNGQKLLNGTMGTQNFQIGANAGELIAANGMNFLTTTYGNNRVRGDAMIPSAFATGGQIATGANGVKISGSLGKGQYKVLQNDTAKTVAEAINRIQGETGVTASASTTAILHTFTANQPYSLSLTADNKTSLVNVAFKIGSDLTRLDSYAEAINAINAQASKTGVSAEFYQHVDATTGNITASGIKLTHLTGENIGVGHTEGTTPAGAVMMDSLDALDELRGAQWLPSSGWVTDTDGSQSASGVIGAPVSGGIVAVGIVTYDSERSFSVTDDSALHSAYVTRVVGTQDMTGASKLMSVSTVDVSTFDLAQNTLAIVDASITIINGERARFGALQRRFEATIDNLRVNSENTTNSRSRIEDADYAEETASLSRSTILQQAGTSMLAQANQVPQLVLQLLQ
ncbi:MAG: flagellin [Burkholderiaceae bacterium]|nr:flagellin [Burkholderiaceae bacterium]